MKRAYVPLEGLDDLRYIVSPQLPGVLIINTNGDSARIVRLWDGMLSDTAVRYLMRRAYEPKEKGLQRGNAEKTLTKQPSLLYPERRAACQPKFTCL